MGFPQEYWREKFLMETAGVVGSQLKTMFLGIIQGF